MGNEVRSSTSTPPVPPASGGPQAPDSGATSGTPTTTGTGCSNVRNPALARTHAANLARRDALRKVCAGGDPKQPVKGTVSGGVSRYFQDGGNMCAEGEFQVTCEPPAPPK